MNSPKQHNENTVREVYQGLNDDYSTGIQFLRKTRIDPILQSEFHSNLNLIISAIRAFEARLDRSDPKLNELVISSPMLLELEQTQKELLQQLLAEAMKTEEFLRARKTNLIPRVDQQVTFQKMQTAYQSRSYTADATPP